MLRYAWKQWSRCSAGLVQKQHLNDLSIVNLTLYGQSIETVLTYVGATVVA